MVKADSEHKEALMSALDENSQPESASTEPLEPVAPLSTPLQVPKTKCEENNLPGDKEEPNSRQDFSKRQDVLGKTMVRSLKRYYLDLFNGSNNFKSFG